MNQFRDKLRSRAGASMMLALVFMLFCAFVGGSVLASATANAQRVGDLQEQQEFLLERSAALLLSDQLQLDSDQHLRLKVVDAQKSIQEVTITNGGGIVNQGDPTQAREITFTLQTNVGTLSQMKLTSTAYSGTSYLNGVVGAPVEREGKTVQITTNYSNTTISWSEPFIEKGGAA